MPISTFVQRAADKRIDCIEGILRYGAHDYLMPGNNSYAYFSLLREPAARWLSYYNFCRVHGNAGLHQLAMDCSLEKFMLSAKRPRNVAARVFAGYSAEPDWDTVLKNFEEFNFVGLQDDFLTSIFLLCDQWGLMFPFAGHVGKRASSGKAVLSNSALECLRAEDFLDFKLHSYAKRRFEERVSALSEKQLGVLSAYLALYEEFFSQKAPQAVLRKVLERGLEAKRSLQQLRQGLERLETYDATQRARFDMVTDYFAKRATPAAEWNPRRESTQSAPPPKTGVKGAAPETLFSHTVTLSNGRQCSLEIDGLFPDLPERVVFLEDRPATTSTPRETFLAASTTVFTSQDCGETWSSSKCQGVRGAIVRCFTLASGQHLIQTSRPYGLYLADAKFRHAHPVQCNAQNHWHGTWSVDQSQSGTICFGEYMDYTRYARIVRSNDGGETWEDALVMENVPGKATTIRHFHYVRSDPYISGRWYAASGDRNHECRLWISNDDAQSWQELGEPNLIGNHPLQALKERRRIYRVVALHIGKDYIYWPTDDLLSPCGPGFFRMSKQPPFEIEYISGAGSQEMRTCIDLGEGNFIGISQANPDKEAVEVMLLRDGHEAEEIARLPKLREGPSAFCKSMASPMAQDGVFFSYAGGYIMDPRPRALRWKVRFYE